MLKILSTDLCSEVGARIGAKVSSVIGASVPLKKTKIVTWLAINSNSSISESREGIDCMRAQVGRTFAEYAVLSRFWKEGRIEAVGVANLTTSSAQGRPVLVIGVHLANWEVLGLTLTKLGFRTAATYNRPRNRFLHKMIVSIRKDAGLDLLPEGHHGAARAVNLLKNKSHVVLMFIDELIDGQAQFPSFGYGFPSRGNAKKAAQLAALTGASLIPAFVERIDGARFKVFFEAPLILHKTNDKIKDLECNIAIIDSTMGKIVRSNFVQWYMLPMWRVKHKYASTD